VPENIIDRDRRRPAPARREPVREKLYGREIVDPYRWLEDAASPQTQRFIEEQNAYTRSVLEKVPHREKLRARVEQFLTIGRVASPRIAGNQYFYERRDGRQNQPIIYVRPISTEPFPPAGITASFDGAESASSLHSNAAPSVASAENTPSPFAENTRPPFKDSMPEQNTPSERNTPSARPGERALIDVNSLAPDGAIALDWWFPSEDGRYVAFGTSANGSEISTLQVIEVESGGLLPEKIERTRAASVAWLPDSTGFYYTRYPRPGEVAAGEEMYHRRVFFHALAAEAGGKDDPLIFPADGHTLDPQHWPGVSLSHDGRWLLIGITRGWTRSDLYLKDLAANGKFQRITPDENFLYHADVLEGHLYITTNEGAPRCRIFKAACAAPERRNWREIIPESEGVIEWYATVFGRRLFVHYSRNASSELRIFDLEGRLAAEVAMQALGTIFDLGGSWDSVCAFFGFISYTIAPTVYEIRPDGKTAKWAGVDSGIDPEQYRIEQRWCVSRDGTRVPMFVVSRKGLARDGTNPALLSGYGGFNVGRTPFFNRNAMLLLLERGGVYVDVQLRGGNEFGEEWHRAGMLERKQNVFDDFIAAAEYLVAEKFTSPERLAIQGGSNGGLLMGAALTQRPELFRAVVCQVPLLDMLRYQHFQIAKLWIPEYGTADDPRQFEYLHAYSPYHRVKPGTVYPAVLFMTAESDTRVDPMHAVKMAALLQAEAANAADRPILLRVDAKAGHGMGKPITKLLDDAVDMWSFLFWQLGISA